MMSYNPLNTLLVNQVKPTEAGLKSCAVGALALATGVVSVFLMKTDRLSRANFRPLIAVVGLVFLAALCKGVQAYGQYRSIGKDIKLIETRQGKFDLAWKIAPPYIANHQNVRSANLFKDDADEEALRSIKEILANGQELPSTDIPPGDVADALRLLFEQFGITGKDLNSVQRNQAKEFFEKLCQSGGHTMVTLMAAWRGTVPAHLIPQGRAAVEVERVTPWVCEGGVFDLVADPDVDRQQLYTSLVGGK